MTNPIDNWPPEYQAVVKPYMVALWKILDYCEARQAELRRLGLSESPEADTLEEVVKATISVPNLIPRPKLAPKVGVTCRIWVDDERVAPKGWLWARSSRHGLELLANAMVAGHVAELSLDHDLGGDDTTRPIVMWMCEHNVWPDVVRCPSQNPVGRFWVDEMVKRYKR